MWSKPRSLCRNDAFPNQYLYLYKVLVLWVQADKNTHRNHNLRGACVLPPFSVRCRNGVSRLLHGDGGFPKYRCSSYLAAPPACKFLFVRNLELEATTDCFYYEKYILCCPRFVKGHITLPTNTDSLLNSSARRLSLTGCFGFCWVGLCPELLF